MKLYRGLVLAAIMASFAPPSIALDIVTGSSISTPSHQADRSRKPRQYPIYQDVTNENTAVLIVDMEEIMVNGHGYIAPPDSVEMEREIGYQVDIIAECKEQGIPIYQVQREGFGPVHPRLLKAMGRGEREPMIKYHLSGFDETSLHEELSDLGIENLIVMGLFAGACVKSTVSDAVQLGYRVITSPEITANSSGVPERDFILEDGISPHRGAYYESHQTIIDILTENKTQ